MRPGYNLAPSASILLTLNAESSNFGGYNGAYGTTQNGALLSILGAFGNCPVALDIYDKDIHSGTFATNPFGESLDNYILQGGASNGFDTGDAFEVAQAHAFFNVAHACPDAGSSAGLLALGLGAFAVARRSRA